MTEPHPSEAPTVPELVHPLQAAGAAVPADESVNEGGDQGEIRIHHQVIAAIARLAALKVPGVAALSPFLAQGLVRLFGKPADNAGIRVTLQERGVVIDLFVVVEMGARIPQVAWQIQNDVRQAVEQMTGKNVRAVNVVVQSLHVAPGRPSGAEGERSS